MPSAPQVNALSSHCATRQYAPRSGAKRALNLRAKNSCYHLPRRFRQNAPDGQTVIDASQIDYADLAVIIPQ